MLDTTTKTQLASYLQKLVSPIELVASLDDSKTATEMAQLLRDIATLSDKISLRENGNAERRPSFGIARHGELPRVHFAGVPMGHEFTSLVLALLHVSGHTPKIDAQQIAKIKALPAGLRFETFISLSCHNCPDVVQALNMIAVLNPGIESVMIDGGAFVSEVETRQIMAVPSVFKNGEAFANGRMALDDILAKLVQENGDEQITQLNATNGSTFIIGKGYVATIVKKGVTMNDGAGFSSLC